MPCKLSESGPTEKFIALFCLLLSDRRPKTVSELCDELGCSRQTVYRLLEQLEASDIGKKYLCIREGACRTIFLKHSKDLPKLDLDAQGLFQLSLCRDFIFNILPPAFRKSVDETLKKAESYLPEAEENSGKELVPVGASISKGCVDYSKFQDILNTVIRGIQTERVLTILYKSSLTSEEKTHDFAARRLVSYHDALYVWGWMVTDMGKALPRFEDPNVLPLQRFQKAELTKRSCAHLPNGEGEEEDRGFGLMDDMEQFPVSVWFGPSVGTYVAERSWSPSQKTEIHEDGSVTLHMQARSEEEVIAWVLGFGSNARLLEPKALQKRLAGITAEMAKCYRQ